MIYVFYHCCDTNEQTIAEHFLQARQDTYPMFKYYATCANQSACVERMLIPL